MTSPRTLDNLQARAAAGEALDYLHFWGHRQRADGIVSASCLSQWYPARFEVDGVAYASAEHFMMAEKARLFGDEAARIRILACRTPAEAKKLGRTVETFDDAVWETARSEIVVRANLAKFSQNLAMRDYLLATGNRVLVEASPVDRIWGIGLAANDMAALHPGAWRGLNLLGFALMEVRSRLT